MYNYILYNNVSVVQTELNLLSSGKSQIAGSCLVISEGSLSIKTAKSKNKTKDDQSIITKLACKFSEDIGSTSIPGDVM